MRGFLDIILVVLFAGSAFTAFSKKEMLGAKKQKLYTRESREKFAFAAGGIYTFLTVFCLFYALCNHGIINLSFNLWLFYGIFLIVGCVGVFVAQKVLLKKAETSDSAAGDGAGQSGEEEDF